MNNRLKRLGWIGLLLLSATIIASVAYQFYPTTIANPDYFCRTTYSFNSPLKPDTFYEGNSSIRLKPDGTGELSVMGYTDHQPRTYFQRGYAFHYQRHGQHDYFVTIVSQWKHPADTTDDHYFRQYIMDLTSQQPLHWWIRPYKNTLLFYNSLFPLAVCVRN